MLHFLEAVVGVLIFVFFLFQIIIPIWKGTLLFPTFRSKARHLEHELRQARSEQEFAMEKKKLDELKGESDDRDERKKDL